MTSRRPGRTALGALAVALAVAAAVLLTAILRAFHGAVVGSFLGDAVAVQVRTPDIAAAVLLAVLGLTAVGTVLLLAVTGDAPALAALHATGWTDAALTRTLLTQAAPIGLLGSVVGVALTLGAMAAALDDPPSRHRRHRPGVRRRRDAAVPHVRGGPRGHPRTHPPPPGSSPTNDPTPPEPTCAGWRLERPVVGRPHPAQAGTACIDHLNGAGWHGRGAIDGGD